MVRVQYGKYTDGLIRHLFKKIRFKNSAKNYENGKIMVHAW